jgi:ABC-2 type transport system permease protein
MEFRKLALIARKDLRILFADRNLLVIMFIAPVALTAIIAAALGGFTPGTTSAPIKDVPVALVNADKGNLFVNYGAIITDLLIPPPGQAPNTLNTLIKARRFESRAAAEAAVRNGDYAAALYIPADFSESLNPTLPKPLGTQIILYRDAGSPIGAGVVSSAIRAITNNLTSGTIAIYAMQGNVSPLQIAALSQAVSRDVSAIVQNAPPVTLAARTVGGETADIALGFNALQYFAPAMAIFFVMFTTAGAAGSIIEEQNTWTLQRIAISPTSRSTILAGKLGGTYLSGLSQLSILIIAMALLGVLFGTANGVWGTNIPGLILLTLATTLAACGIGVFIGGMSRTVTQADTLSNIIVTFSGMLGGAFFPVATLGGPFDLMSKLTINYWGTNGYAELARSSNLAAILPNVGVLLLMFAVYFTIGTIMFNRRLKA